MEGFLIRGWELIVSGCDGTPTLPPGAVLAERWLYEPIPTTNHTSASRGGVSTPCGAVQTRVVPQKVSGLWEL